ncbi:MAG: hypothetical protein DCF20_14780 [Pseudanabaena sp.]|nr:MAG: hypothetical protein DCF20_14780 [Pseudanabaena sp.]
MEEVTNNSAILEKAGYYFDVSAYANNTISNQCSAFYPMLGWITRYIFKPQNFEQAVISLRVISSIFFVLTIPALSYLFHKITKNSKLSFLLTLVHTLSPLSIFRVIGYTEGLFSFLSIILIYLISNKKTDSFLRYIATFTVVVTMSLTRPVSLQLIFSSLISVTVIFLINTLLGNSFKERLPQIDCLQARKHFIKLSVIIILATIVGYGIYGFICLQIRGDFLAPFNDQKLWGKELGFYPNIFLSIEYPLFEQMALYFPIFFHVYILIYTYSFINKISVEIFVPKLPLLWGILSLYPSILLVVYLTNLIVRKFNNKGLQKIGYPDSIQSLPLISSYVFWFCLSFVISHILINLFTVDKLYSLARFTFSLPFFYIFLAYILTTINTKKTEVVLQLFVVVSAIGLIEQWVRYGRHQWLG